MDTINLKLQLVEDIEKQLVLGEQLIARHLQTRKTKPALISPSIVFKDAIASEKDPSKAIHFLKAISNAWLIVLNSTRIKSLFATLAYQSQSHLELEDPKSSNSKLDTTRPSSISRYEIFLTSAILG
jgi:hypothetical protein